MDWEDQHQEEEEAFQYLPHAQLALAFEKTIIYECDTLVIAEHGPAALFAYSLVGSAAPVNRLNFSKAKQSALADLYLQQDRKTYYLIFKGQTEPMKEVHFTDFLESWLKSKKVILLLSVSRTTLKDSNSPPLACISTSTFEKGSLPQFGQGIEGIPAEILVWGEINRVPVGGFIATFGEYELSAEIVQTGFGALRGRHGLVGNFDIGEQVRKYNMKKYSNKLYL